MYSTPLLIFQYYKKEQHINTDAVLVNEKTKTYLLKVAAVR
jgi:hypothetical protein